ncbi:unnamed protein product [Adineta ricciae]|uniref:Uncharacterized protein n=1 Tax=Adineta ricciae TaxID=249248 RepID=A0A815BC70_ADIRI|nr:unnamed protein product [Adineta ricciae]CAF1314651.1 unnamed protein product [Adineta ricciae]
MAEDQETEDILGRSIERHGPQLNTSKSARVVIRFRTHTALKLLDSKCKTSPFRLFYQTGLINVQKLGKPLVMCADLSGLVFGSPAVKYQWKVFSNQ